ncbi:heat shock 70 kDa protein 4, partial [Biomphalaria glabrata]
DRSQFSLRLEDTENWLYEEGEDQHKQVYIDKLMDLKKLGQPVVDRNREAQEWPVARDEMGSTVQQIKKFLDQWAQKDEKYDHIEKADVDKVEKLLTEKSNWFGQRLTQMAQLKPHENPVVLAAQVRAEKQILENVCHPIMNKAKPKVDPPKEEKKDKSSNKAEGDQNNSKEGSTPQQGSKEPEQEMDVD